MLSKVTTLPKLLEAVGKFPRDKKVGMACGCFDIVHPGHYRHLSYVKSKADIVVVMLTADKHITKGTYRPHVPQQIRAESLAALEIVSYVIIDENADHLINIEAIKPDYFAKGFEYSDEHHEATKAEIRLVEGYGGQMLFTPGDVVYSSTKLLNTYLPKLRIEKLVSLMKQFDITFEGMRDAIKKFNNYKIHVIGDLIIDTYTRTNLIGSNAKTPTFSVLYDGHHDYIGGAAIVAQHLKAAGADVTFTTVLGNDGKCCHLEGILMQTFIDENRPTTNKNTIIAGDYRLLKIDTVDNSPISGKGVAYIEDRIAETKTDAVIFSDFRHGIFSRQTIPEFTDSIPKGALKVADSQVASRWGNITEFKGFDLITPNEKEARFALADQDSNIGRLAANVQEECSAKNIILKLGPRGVFFIEDDSPYSVDSFAGDVKDAVGAGDALLAYATLTMLATKSLPMACIIGSMAAACECEVDGNKPITPQLVLAKLDEVEAMV